MAAVEDHAVSLTLALHYRHPLGELAPYFRGLEEGRAVAARCPVCGRTWFPPRVVCPVDNRGVEWVELSGLGRIISLTVTETTLPFGGERARRAFAMISLDGAENTAFGRLAGDPDSGRPGQRVRLARAAGNWPHPAQAAWFVLGN